MKPGFYTIMAAQFFSSLADQALIVTAIALLRELHEPAWMTPALRQCFAVSYVVLAPLSNVLDLLTLLSLRQHVAVLATLLLLFAVWWWWRGRILPPTVTGELTLDP